MTLWGAPITALAALGLALVPLGSRAQTGSVPAVLAGTWVSESSSASAMAHVLAAFEPGVTSLPELFQGMARDRIRSSMVPPSRVVVTLTGTHVNVSMRTNRMIVIDGELGAEARLEGGEGDPTVTTGLRGGWLEIRWDGEGDMQQLLSTEPDGSRMHLDYTVESDRLPEPVRYRLDFRH